MKILSRKTLSLLAGFCLLSFFPVHGAQARPGNQVVVELYTSQGCNSCPPADHLLGEMAARDDLIALTFNVDYWDYLGWKDTLAQPAHTDRQRHYAADGHGRPATARGLGRILRGSSDRSRTAPR